MKKIILGLLVMSTVQMFGQATDSLTFYTKKANEMTMRGKYVEAIGFCNQGLRLSPNNCKMLKMKANAFASLGKTDDEKATYLTSIDKKCYVTQNLLNLKSMYFDAGNNQEALNYLNKVITLRPDSGALYYERWSIKTILKDSVGGAKDLQKAKDLGYESAIKMDQQMKQKDAKEKPDTDD